MKSFATPITKDKSRRNASSSSESIGISRVSLAFFLTAFMACSSVLLSMSVSMLYAHGDHADAARPLMDPTVVCAPPMALILAGLIFTIMTGMRLASKSWGRERGKNALSRSRYATLINPWCSTNRWACVTVCKAKMSEPKKGENQNGRSHAS
jgi:hypothetical protein